MELLRMGADIKCEKNVATINGNQNLKAAEVMATDLRASVSLVLTALAIKGKTTINRIYHLERGYERLMEKLNKCGADINILL
jgi:UDP-N-acetylglucosamine 1-carboxyvinyltransferase